jgi:hypothetical protein
MNTRKTLIEVGVQSTAIADDFTGQVPHPLEILLRSISESIQNLRTVGLKGNFIKYQVGSFRLVAAGSARLTILRKNTGWFYRGS